MPYQLALVIRYLRHVEKTEQEIESYVRGVVCNYYVNSSIIDFYCKESFKFVPRLPPVRTDSLYITKELLDYIHENACIPELEDFLFCYVCLYLYKYNKRRYFVTLKEIYPILGRRFGRKSDEIYYLYHNDLIDIKPYRYTEFVVPTEKFQEVIDRCQKATEFEMVISNLLNLPYYYLNYFGLGKFKFCTYCGAIYKVTGKRQKFCKNCGAFINATICKPERRKREKELLERVIDLKLEGKKPREIAEILDISIPKAKKYSADGFKLNI